MSESCVRPGRWSLFVAALPTFLLLQAEVDAQDVGQPDAKHIELSVSHVESDNIGRVAEGPRGSFEGIGLDLLYARSSSHLRVDVQSDLELRRYADDEFENEAVGTVAALLDVDIVPGRFEWRFSENFTQGQTDPFLSDGPANRENVSVFSTGPTVTVPVSERSYVQIEGSIVRRRYEESKALEGDVQTYRASLYRQTSTVSRVSLFVQVDDIDYDSQSVPYEFKSLGLRYEKTLATGSVYMDLGRNRISGGAAGSDGPVVAIGWDRDIGRRSRLTVLGERSFTDSGMLFGEGSTLPSSDLRISDTVLTSSAVERESVDVLYSTNLSRTDMSIGLGSYDVAYFSDPLLDGSGRSAVLQLQRDLTPRLNVTLELVRNARDYPALGLEECESSANVAVGRRFGRGLIGYVSLERHERSRLNPFDELRYELRLAYSPNGRR